MLGWLMGQTEPSFEVLAWLCLGGSLIYTGGMYLNDAFDVRFDRSFRPERGLFHRGPFLWVGCVSSAGSSWSLDR